MLYLAPSARLHACLLAHASQQHPRRSSAWSSVDHVSPRVAISTCSASLPNCDASVQSSVDTKEAPVAPPAPKTAPRRGRPRGSTNQQHTVDTAGKTPDASAGTAASAPSPPTPGRRGRPRKTPVLPSQTASSPSSPPDAAQTELVFVLERRGHGWGEEIIPHLVVEERPIAAKKRSPVGVPAPWELGSLEQQLLEAGVAEDAIDNVVARAVAWRTTRGGRLLVDRRRRSRVERNMGIVVQHLLENGVAAGAQGIGAVLTKAPELLLCKPTTNDRWDRRVVELAAFWVQHGHCDVPETHVDPGLSAWVKRQRMVHAQGQLGSERLLVLKALGFEFGEIAHMTADWERQFDALLDWVMWNDEQKMTMNWLGLDWGARGGVAARQLALWVQMQREFRRRGLLGPDSIRRLETIGFRWNPPRSSADDRRWLSQLGRVLYLVERWKASAQLPPPRATVGVPPELAARGLGRRYKLQVALEQEVTTRRAALQRLTLESGLGYWIAKQRWLWRQGALDQERTLMLELAGVELSVTHAGGVQSTGGVHSTAGGVHSSGGGVQSTGGGVHSSGGGGGVTLVGQDGASSMGNNAAVAPGAQHSMSWFYEAQRAASALIGSGVRWPGAPPPTPINRVALRRWVWTQRALWCQGRLGGDQQRFLAVCGVVWILSSEVLLMQPPAWQARYVALVSAMSHGVRGGTDVGGVGVGVGVTEMLQGGRVGQRVKQQQMNGQRPGEQQQQQQYNSQRAMEQQQRITTLVVNSRASPPPTRPACPVHAAAAHSSQLRDWLQHQKALRVLGMLPREREVQLSGLGLVWDLPPEAAQQEWDAAVSQMLAFEQRHGRVFDVHRDGVGSGDEKEASGGGVAAGQDQTLQSTGQTLQSTGQTLQSTDKSTGDAVPLAPAAAVGNDDAVCDAQARMLRSWVLTQQVLASRGELSSGKQAVLKLLGVKW